MTAHQANTTVINDNDDLGTNGTFDYVALKNHEFQRPEVSPTTTFENINE